jgi:ribosomal protein S18 acetylase RimI-like enzyme
MNFIFKDLTRDFVKTNIRDFVKIASDNIVDEYWGEKNFLAELDKKWDYSFVMIDDDRKIAGFLIASEKQHSIHIHKFIVDSPFQRMGLGALMMKAIFKKAGQKPVTLKVQEKNEKALAFYKNHGFVIDGNQNALYTMIYQP